MAAVVKVAERLDASCGRMPMRVPLMPGMDWPYRRVVGVMVALSCRGVMVRTRAELCADEWV